MSYPVAYDFLDLKGVNRFWYSEINSFEQYDIITPYKIISQTLMIRREWYTASNYFITFKN